MADRVVTIALLGGDAVLERELAGPPASAGTGARAGVGGRPGGCDPRRRRAGRRRAGSGAERADAAARPSRADRRRWWRPHGSRGDGQWRTRPGAPAARGGVATGGARGGRLLRHARARSPADAARPPDRAASEPPAASAPRPAPWRSRRRARRSCSTSTSRPATPQTSRRRRCGSPTPCSPWRSHPPLGGGGARSPARAGARVPGAPGAVAGRARRSHRRGRRRPPARRRSGCRVRARRRRRTAGRGRDLPGARTGRRDGDRQHARPARSRRRWPRAVAAGAARVRRAPAGRSGRAPGARRGGAHASRATSGVPLWAAVDEHRDVSRARDRGLPPPARPFARLVVRARRGVPAMTLWDRTQGRRAGHRADEPAWRSTATHRPTRSGPARRSDGRRGARQRPRAGLGRAARAAAARGRARSPTSRPCATRARGSSPRPGGASTTPLRWSTPGSPTARG